jgi:hypothetical protein
MRQRDAEEPCTMIPRRIRMINWTICIDHRCYIYIDYIGGLWPQLYWRARNADQSAAVTAQAGSRVRDGARLPVAWERRVRG